MVKTSGPLVRSFRAAWHSRPTILVVIAIWAIGLTAFIAVTSLQARVDRERHAQVVVGAMQGQMRALSLIAFSPALAGHGLGPPPALTTLRLDAGKNAVRESISTLATLDGGRESARIDALSGRYLRSVDRIAALVVQGPVLAAALEFGSEQAAGGSYGALFAELTRADSIYSASAARWRLAASAGTVAAIVFMLLSFSVVLYRATRLVRRNHQLLERSRVDALTDALTGLPNRRKLFADMGSLLGEEAYSGRLALCVLDLNGFKRYNDAFGHPAGDVLLARLGRKLAKAMDGHGSAYRMGGDEFCVISRGPDAERLLAAAALALSERGDGFDISCSLGSAVIAPGEMTLEQALQHADQRLYDNKAAFIARADGEAYAVLLGVLAEDSLSLALHLSTVGRLAEAVARRLGLSEEEVTLTRLTAELHDVGKLAIPDSILDKPGPLDDAEWAFMKRHTIIGQRILAAAPALAAVAPLVRSSHERPDGSGYPDGLSDGEIPISSCIVAVVDAYDAMTSERAYSRPLPPPEAIAELRRCAGSQFDAEVAEAFIAVWEESLQPVKPTSDPAHLFRTAA